MERTREQIKAELGINESQFTWAITKFQIRNTCFRKYSEEDFQKIKSYYTWKSVPQNLILLKELAQKLNISTMSVEKYAKILGFERTKERFSCDDVERIRYPREAYEGIKNYILNHFEEITKFRHSNYFQFHQNETEGKEKKVHSAGSKKWAYEHLTSLTKDFIDKTYVTEWFPDVVPNAYKENAE